jgi:hypothetical protein
MVQPHVLLLFTLAGISIVDLCYDVLAFRQDDSDVLLAAAHYSTVVGNSTVSHLFVVPLMGLLAASFIRAAVVRSTRRDWLGLAVFCLVAGYAAVVMLPIEKSASALNVSDLRNGLLWLMAGHVAMIAFAGALGFEECDWRVARRVRSKTE